MPAYYNEIEPFAAQWLRNLIIAGHIAPGDVDERSIADVQPDDLRGFTQCHFFAGIGVWSYALRLAGWADDRPVWTGSCPCQPFSAAGKGAGYADERHLWPHWHRLIAECRPPAIFGEQVAAAIRTGWLDDVCLSLEALGYAVGAVDFPACSVGAPHIRSRVYFVADADVPERGRGELGFHTQDRGGNGAARVGECADGALAHDDQAGRSVERRQGLRANNHASRRHDADRCGEPDHFHFAPAADGQSFVMGDAERAGSQGRERSGNVELHRGSGSDGSTPAAGFWSDAIWLPCADGKARPTQPGIFPLAHGTTQRVGKLRAAGNAIVGPQAAEFIRAYLGG